MDIGLAPIVFNSHLTFLNQASAFSKRKLRVDLWNEIIIFALTTTISVLYIDLVKHSHRDGNRVYGTILMFFNKLPCAFVVIVKNSKKDYIFIFLVAALYFSCNNIFIELLQFNALSL